MIVEQSKKFGESCKSAFSPSNSPDETLDVQVHLRELLTVPTIYLANGQLRFYVNGQARIIAGTLENRNSNEKESLQDNRNSVVLKEESEPAIQRNSIRWSKVRNSIKELSMRKSGIPLISSSHSSSEEEKENAVEQDSENNE